MAAKKKAKRIPPKKAPKAKRIPPKAQKRGVKKPKPGPGSR